MKSTLNLWVRPGTSAEVFKNILRKMIEDVDVYAPDSVCGERVFVHDDKVVAVTGIGTAHPDIILMFDVNTKSPYNTLV